MVRYSLPDSAASALNCQGCLQSTDRRGEPLYETENSVVLPFSASGTYNCFQFPPLEGELEESTGPVARGHLCGQ